MCLFCGPYRSHLIHISSHHIFYASTLWSQLFNLESSVEFLLGIFHLKVSITCDTIIMFNLIIASLLRSRFLDFTQRSTLYNIIANLDRRKNATSSSSTSPSARKENKKILYICDVSIRGNIIKNDAKRTDLFPHWVFLLRAEGSCAQVTAS